MKYAFIRKNFYNLGKEIQTIFLLQFLSVLFVFFPVISTYSPDLNWRFHSVLQGETWLIGFLILILSLSVITYFIGKITESFKIKLPIEENILLFSISLFQILLTILAWSVLIVVKNNFDNTQVRFGIALLFLSYVVNFFLALFLIQKSKKAKTMSFFEHPNN